ncbi:hypothetical protein BN946_scf184912.g9 [Trametes cinnabarina]|uniref:Uncharacterized protein n=1 Tax=Pycnoporus cinnabarinus TaxID=5643 RepID=A0A060SSZ5_PYCCI|nr:hypothetical protein BN946_scf184912.g9 [Trametes cinnabarina]
MPFSNGARLPDPQIPSPFWQRRNYQGEAGYISRESSQGQGHSVPAPEDYQSHHGNEGELRDKRPRSSRSLPTEYDDTTHYPETRYTPRSYSDYSPTPHPPRGYYARPYRGYYRGGRGYYPRGRGGYYRPDFGDHASQFPPRGTGEGLSSNYPSSYASIAAAEDRTMRPEQAETAPYDAARPNGSVALVNGPGRQNGSAPEGIDINRYMRTVSSSVPSPGVERAMSTTEDYTSRPVEWEKAGREDLKWATAAAQRHPGEMRASGREDEGVNAQGSAMKEPSVGAVGVPAHTPANGTTAGDGEALPGATSPGLSGKVNGLTPSPSPMLSSRVGDPMRPPPQTNGCDASGRSSTEVSSPIAVKEERTLGRPSDEPSSRPPEHHRNPSSDRQADRLSVDYPSGLATSQPIPRHVVRPEIEQDDVGYLDVQDEREVRLRRVEARMDALVAELRVVRLEVAMLRMGMGE